MCTANYSYLNILVSRVTLADRGEIWLRQRGVNLGDASCVPGAHWAHVARNHPDSSEACIEALRSERRGRRRRISPEVQELL